MLPNVYATVSNPTTPSIAPNTYNPTLSASTSVSALSVKSELGYNYPATIDPPVRTMASMPANQLPLSGPDNGYLRGEMINYPTVPFCDDEKIA